MTARFCLPPANSLFDLLQPAAKVWFTCAECGDRFEAQYRVGCFGPTGVTVRRVRVLFFQESGESILCAHCGHELWEEPDQVALREAAMLADQVDARFQGELSDLLRADREARLRSWRDRLTLEHFRSLNPILFAALWEGAPAPNPKTSLPTKEAKKPRFFLRQVGKALGDLPPLPPPGSALEAACRAALQPEQETFALLSPRLQQQEDPLRLVYDAFVPEWKSIEHPPMRPRTQPPRGCTEACYREEAFDLEALERRLAAPLEAVETPEAPSLELLEDRLVTLLRRRITGASLRGEG